MPSNPGAERPGRLQVGLTRSLFRADGSPAFDFGLELLDGRPDIEWEIIPTDAEELPGELLARYDAIIVELPGDVTARSLEGADRLRLVARVGVGYDNVDVDACTARGVLLTTTPDGVRRPMAVAAITLILALSQHLTARDRLSREGRWNDRAGFVGLGLAGRTLGLVGLGNIGREAARLAEPFELVRIAYDPYVSDEQAAAANIRLMSLEELMATADFVVVTCALVPETLRLIDADRIALMRPDAFLVNVARGPIVDQQALTEALEGGRIAGAGLDVFDPEPLAADDPLTRLDNVILTAHSLGWTDHCFRDCGVSAIRSVIALAEGGRPEHVVNRQALEHARWTS